MKLLLLGCSGFVGRQLIPYLIQEGHSLTIVSRKRNTKVLLGKHHEQLSYINLDPSKSLSWKEKILLNAIEESEGVINLAGEPIAEKRWTKKQCQLIEDSRLNTTSYLINAIQKLSKPPSILINASAIGFYGTSLYDEFNERSSSGNDFLANICQRWEEAAKAKPKSTRLVILRIGIVMGKDGGALGKMLPIFKAGLGGPLGNGLQWMSWIHRYDLCRIIGAALNNKSWSGSINCIAPKPIQMFQFCETLGMIINRPSLIQVPGFLLKFLLGDGAKVVLEGQKVTSVKLKNLGFSFKYPTIQSAINAAISEDI
ncbi:MULTISPECIES: TIGR01777 family oxidoreductase [Prochlorococcus]|uniref:TIGR01777 family oxidoreductase n=1 Tax=Prochlorococcus TaxID=1218 RepID=UPI000533B7B3|nr:MULTISPECIES: TIGR01777 family oxidoreductase [Prochlorococcus]KGG13255.1 Cell division inhibitor [Prochlorococcus sp. MIT 0601]